MDYKIISKALASRVKKVLLNLISPQQTAYVENRFIGENGRLIADTIAISDVINKEGFLVTMDIEKAFDSLDHTFVISVFKKFSFGSNFVSWIETLISKQESCVFKAVALPSTFILKEGLAKVILFRPISLSLL